MRGSTYIPLPKALRNKKACINVRNWDDGRFYGLYYRPSILHQKAPKGHTSTPPNTDSTLPAFLFQCNLPQILKFKKQNNLAVNIFGWENEGVSSLWMFPSSTCCSWRKQTNPSVFGSETSNGSFFEQGWYGRIARYNGCYKTPSWEDEQAYKAVPTCYVYHNLLARGQST